MKSPNPMVSVVFLLTLLVGALGVSCWLFSSFLQPIAFAIVLGIGFYPLYGKVSRVVRGATKASLLTTVAVLLIIVLPALIVTSAAGGELIKSARYLSEQSVQQGGAASYIARKQQSVLQWLGKYVDVEELRLEDAMSNLPSQASKFLFAAGTGLVGGLASFAGNSILTFLILFFVFRDGAAAVDGISSILPMGRQQTARLLGGIRDSIVANLYGILAVGLAQGLLTGIALAVLRVPSALLLGLTAAICSLVPIVGTMLVWLPAAIYLMATGHLWKGIFLVLWGVLVVGTADNIIRPLVIGSKVELHPLLLFFALLGGIQAFGFIGVFVGPVVLSVIGALVSILREELAASPPSGQASSVPS